MYVKFIYLVLLNPFTTIYLLPYYCSIWYFTFCMSDVWLESFMSDYGLN